MGIAALPWVLYRKLSNKRPVAAIRERITGRICVADCPQDHGRIWLHGVSVGEVQLLRTLIAELEKQAHLKKQLIDCVLSSSTTTGLEVATRGHQKDHVFPCPLDFSWAIREALDRVRPDLLILGELELWPNLLRIADDYKIPVLVVNGRMSQRSYQGYRKVQRFAASMLRRVSLVLSRSSEDSERFSKLGAPAVETIGSLKFDGIDGDRHGDEVRHLKKIIGIGDDDFVFVAGSTQQPEEMLALETFLQQQKIHPRLKLILVPRHVERSQRLADSLAKRLRQTDARNIPMYYRSALNNQTSPPSDESFILLVDVTGELAALWGLATVAFVGGSLDGVRGGQNMLEPAAYGAAICFGPFTRNFHAEVTALLEADAAVVIHRGEELTEFVAQCLTDLAFSRTLGANARNVIDTNQGRTMLTAKRILEFLPVISS